MLPIIPAVKEFEPAPMIEHPKKDDKRTEVVSNAGLDNPPVRVIEADDKTVAELSLLENLQREDLNPIEEAEAYQRLMDEFGLSMEELAQKMGMKQTWRIRERTDLLRLHTRYRKMLIDKYITPSQAFELSRLPHEKQHILYEKIREGRADTYNKLRALSNALLVPPPQQTVFGGNPSDEERQIGKKYDEMVDRLLSFIRRSFNAEDLKVLKRVVESDVSVNIQKLDLIIADLNRIKRAMIEAESRKEAQAA
jgi:transcriptional regulator with XRE-family HTH domain